MKVMLHRLYMLVPVFFWLIAACGENDSALASPDPRDVAKTILELHDLLGRQPEDRSEASREKEIPPAELEKLIVDYSSHDRFISDIYVGFTVGVLSRNQTRLFPLKKGKRAELAAGKATVHLDLIDGRWLINLGRTVPSQIKERAALEKKKFDDAKARANRDIIP